MPHLRSSKTVVFARQACRLPPRPTTALPDTPMSEHVCVIKGCELPVVALELCVNHWRRLRKYGSPIVLRIQSKNILGDSDEERFEKQVRKTGTCWIWAGSTDRDNYGVFRGTVGEATYMKAHRYALAAALGKPLPAGFVVMHLCDNPRCVNPEHLQLGTTRENVLDKFAKGRGGLPKGAMRPRIVLTAAQQWTIAIDARPNVQVAADYGVTAAEVGRVRARGVGQAARGDAIPSGMQCAIKGCNENAFHLGLCTDHWRRCSEYGAPTINEPNRGRWNALPASERLMAQIRKDGDCWMWTGFTDRDGYGRMRAKVGGVLINKAHTLSYTLHTGELVPKGMLIMHSCDRPGCVNPEHLRVGTHRENSQDMHAKGRARDQTGENGSKAKVTTAVATAILADARPYAAIAQDYGIAASTVGSIKQRKSWKGLKVDKVAKAKKVGMRGETQWQAKLTEADVRFIRSSSAAGKELAAKFLVTPQAITNIRKRRIWKHVE